VFGCVPGRLLRVPLKSYAHRPGRSL
jgi:hypothetical protein